MLLDECATAYDELEKAHYLWVDYLHDDKPDADAAKVYLATTSEWLTGIDEFYEEAVDAASAMIPDQETVADTSLLNSSTDQGASQRPAPTSGNFTLDLSEAMAEKLLPPSVQCMTFGDNPKEWKLFETEFEVNVKTFYKCERRLASYLLKFTTDKAKACVKPHVTSGSLTPFSDAWKDLQSLFGTPAILARHILNDLKDGPSVVTADELLNFAREIKQAVDQLAHTPHESDIKGHAIIDDLLVRLSNAVHLKWAKSALRYKVTHEKYPDINEFLTFIKLLAAESNDEYYGTEASKRRATRSNARYKDKKSPRNVNSPSNTSSCPQEIQVSAISAQTCPSPRKAVPVECLYCKAARHDLKSCPAFMGLGHAMRWNENLQKSKICWKCLSVNCSNHAKCKVSNPCTCSMPYHWLLHPPPCSAQKAAVPSGVNDNAFVQTANGYTILPIVEVICGSKVTYALQDSASTASYIVEDLVKELKLETHPSHNYTRTLNGTTDTNHRVVASIKVRGRGHSTFQTINNVFVCTQIPATTRTVAMRSEDYPYLEGLPLDAQRGETVGLLIGSDSGLNIPLDIIKHPTHPEMNPYAVRYRLGWSIAGCMPHLSPSNPHIKDCAFVDCQRRPIPRVSQAYPEADVQRVHGVNVHQGKKKTAIKTDEDKHHCKYTTKCTHMLNQTGESMVSISQTEVPPPLITCDRPRKLRTGVVRKCQSTSLQRQQAPDLCKNKPRRNDTHSGMMAPANRPSRQQKAKVDTTDPSSHPDVIITPSTCSSPSDDVQSPPGDDTHVSAVMDQPQGVREEGISRLSTHVTTSIAHTAMKTSKHPIMTTTKLGESSQPDPISKLSEFNCQELSHEYDKKLFAWLVYIIISFIYIHRLLIYVGTICLYTATWMLTMLKSKKKSGARSLRRFKPSMHAKSSKSKQSKSLADHVTPGKICTSCLHICYIASAILFCACLVKYIPEKNLLVSASQDYMLYIQERNLTRSSPFDTMAAKQDRSLRLTPLVHSTSHTQERNHRDHRSKSMMQKIRAWNTDSTRNKLSFIQQSAIQDVESSMLHHPQHPVTKLVKLKSEYC